MERTTWSKNRFGRNIRITHTRGFFYNAQNQKTGFYRRLWGDYDVEQATKELIKIMGTSRIMIEEVEHETMWCSMPVEKFFDNCDIRIHKD